MEEDERNEELKLSKINTAGLQNFRRDDIWKDANKHSRTGEYGKWNEDLDAMWRELSGSVKENSDSEKNFKKIDDKYSKIKKIHSNKNFKSITKEEYLKMIEQKKVLTEKEEFLRRLEDSQGKGTAYQDDADEYMMG